MYDLHHETRTSDRIIVLLHYILHKCVQLETEILHSLWASLSYGDGQPGSRNLEWHRTNQNFSRPNGETSQVIVNYHLHDSIECSPSISVTIVEID